MCTPAAVSATWLLSPTYSPVRSWRMSWTPEPRNLWPSVRCDRHWHYASARTRTLSRPGCPITRAGSQYTPTHLRRLLAVHQIDGSIGTVGDAYDNGLMESTIGLYKSELIDFEAETWTNWGGGGTRHSRMGPLVRSRAVAFLARAYPADQALHQLPTRKPRRPSRRVTRHSQKVRPIHNTSRRMLFDEFERGVLGELPTTPWQHTEWKRAKVAPNFHITVNTARYLSALPACRPDCRCTYHWQ